MPWSDPSQRQKAIASMKEQGVDVIDLPDAERAKMVEKGEKFVGEWVETATAAGLPGEALLDEYRALIAKYTAERDDKGYPWAKTGG